MLKRITVNTLLVLASIIMAFALVDLALHIGRFQYLYVSPQAPQGYFRYDAELGYDITPSFATSTHTFYDFSYPVWSNRLGCFDHEFDGDVPYIYVGGDSMAWGFTPLGEKWGKKMQDELGIRTLNCGENGYGTRQEVIKARRTLETLPRPPQVIVVSYFDNDGGDDVAFPNYGVHRGYVVWGQGQCPPEALSKLSPLKATTTCNVAPIKYSALQKLKFELGLHSVLYSVFTATYGKVIKSWLQPFTPRLGFLHPFFPWLVPDAADNAAAAVRSTITDDSSTAWRVHTENLLAFRDLARLHGAKLLFVLIPDRDTLGATSTSPTWENSRVAEFLKASGIEYLDLWPDFKARPEPQHAFYWPVNGHMNIAGNQLTGLLVSKHLIEHGFVQAAEPSASLQRINDELSRDFPAGVR